MTSSESDAYIPGVCNIGKAEIKKRRNAVISAALLLLGFVLIIELFQAGRFWRLSIIIPAFSLGLSYLQWYYKFCAAFGLKGVFNFGSIGSTFTVDQKENYKSDRKKAWSMITKAIIFAVIVTMFYFFLR